MIKLFKSNGVKDSQGTVQWDEKPELLKAKLEIFQESIGDLFGFLKAFALDVQELQVHKYQNLIDELGQEFQQIGKPADIKSNYQDQKARIRTFIADQQRYIADREKELRDIIDLMTKAMAGLNAENSDFYQHVFDQGEKILEISLLDDIKKIRQSLQQEVAQMHSLVESKQNQDKRQIQVLAGQVVELRKELEEVRTKSMTDGLTGAFNRQALDETLVEKIEDHKNNKTEYCLLLMDLDNFKTINDKHGHLIGDRMLIAFSQKCRSSIRGGDFLARYGGEEFAIILENINLRDGLKKASEICKNVAAARYATDENQSEGLISITVSIGVSPINKSDTVETLIARTDKALYDAKRKGKNMAIGRKN